MSQCSVDADTVINSLAQRIAALTVDAAVKDAHIDALTAELAAKAEPEGEG